MPFSKQQQLELTELLASENYPDSLSFGEAHGFLSALCSGPSQCSKLETVNLVLFGEKESDQKIEESLKTLILELLQHIEKSLFSSDTLLLPCSLQLEDDDISESLADWTLGFFEAHLLDEDSWYKQDEELVAEMLLPFLVCIDELEESDLEAIREQSTLLQNLILQLPQALQDLYLFFHADS